MGTLQDLVEQARRGEVDCIYITFPMRAEERIRGVLEPLSDTPASVYVVPDFFVFQLLHSRWTDILGLPVVSVFEHPFYGIDGVVKRAVGPCLRRRAVDAGGRADGADRAGDQAYLARSGAVSPAALWARRPGDSRVEVPHDARLRRRAASRAGHAERSARDRRRRGSCGDSRSTSCRNCST